MIFFAAREAACAPQENNPAEARRARFSGVHRLCPSSAADVLGTPAPDSPNSLNTIVLGGIAGRPGNADAAVPFALAVLGRGRSPAGTTAPGGLRNPEPRRTTHWRRPGSVSVTLTLISIAAVVVVLALVEWLLLRLVHGPLRSPPASSSQKT
jgi:hypothetical protein